jgi:MFS family permease
MTTEDASSGLEERPLTSSTPLPSETTPLLQGQPLPKADNEQDDEQTVIVENYPTGRLVLVLSTAFFGVFLGAIDSTIIATLGGPISSEFKSLSLLSWIATAYLISNAAFQPISGRLTDIFGRGPGLVFSNAFFAAGNLICGLAKDKNSMIAGRVIAGIGGGGLMSITTFLTSDLVPLRKRGLLQGIGNLSYGSGAMLGGVFGGLMNDHTKLGWRLAFLIQVPPVILSGILVGIMVRVPPKVSKEGYLERIDFAGVILIVGFLVMGLLGLNAGGNLVPWNHPLPIASLLVSVIIFIGFWAWEGKAKHPIIPVQMLAERTVFSACLTNFVVTMATMMLLFYIPLYLQVLGYTATQAGLGILPASIGTSICSLGSGLIMNKTGKYMTLGISSLVLFVAGVSATLFLNESTASWLPPAASFFTGGAYGSMLTVTLLACLAAVDHSYQAVITSATCEYLHHKSLRALLY